MKDHLQCVLREKRGFPARFHRPVTPGGRVVIMTKYIGAMVFFHIQSRYDALPQVSETSSVNDSLESFQRQVVAGQLSDKILIYLFIYLCVYFYINVFYIVIM